MASTIIKKTIKRRTRADRTILRESARLMLSKEGKIGVDCLTVLEEAMWYFHGLARLEQKRKDPSLDRVKGHYLDAAMMAEKLAPFRFPRLAAIKVAQGPSVEEQLRGKTIEQLRADLIAGYERLGLFETIPSGVANRTINGNGKAD